MIHTVPPILLLFSFLLVLPSHASDTINCASTDTAACFNADICLNNDSNCRCGNFLSCPQDHECEDFYKCVNVATTEFLDCEANCEVCWDRGGSSFTCYCEAGGSCPDSNFECDTEQTTGAEFYCVAKDASPTPQPTGLGGAGGGCVSPYLLVEVKNQGPTYIKDLDEQDEILIASTGDNKSDYYDTVYAFSHKDTYVVTTFVQIYTSHRNQDVIELTGDHYLFKVVSSSDSSSMKQRSVPVRADSVRVGDLLVSSSSSSNDYSEIEVVLEISQVQRQGIYAPQTKHGTFVGGGVQVSSYTALSTNNSEEESLLLNDAWFQHVLLAPFRFLCTTTTSTCSICQTTDADGLLLFVAAGKQFMESQRKTLLQQSPIQLIAFLKTMAFYTMEDHYCCCALLFLFPALIWMMTFYRRNIHRKP